MFMIPRAHLEKLSGEDKDEFDSKGNERDDIYTEFLLSKYSILNGLSS